MIYILILSILLILTAGVIFFVGLSSICGLTLMGVALFLLIGVALHDFKRKIIKIWQTIVKDVNYCYR